MTQENEESQIAKIVIVDDSSFSRLSINQMLEDEPGITVVGEASNSEDASKILSERDVDIAIIDVVMPDVSGIDLAKGINKSRSDISIIMISSLAQEHVIIDAISAGAVDFLQKPFTKDALLNSIRKIQETEEI